MDYRTWFERFPARFADERADMEGRGFALDENAFKDKRVEFLGKSSTDPSIKLRVTFPDSFPSMPPHVHTTGPALLKRHQRPDTREICTFGPTHTRWVASLSSTAAVDEAEGVIAAVSGNQSGGLQYLDDVPEPASALYFYRNDTFVLVPPAIATFAARMAEGSSARFKVRFEGWPGKTPTRNGPGRGILIEAGQSFEVKADSWHQSILPSRSQLEINGRIVRLGAPPPLIANISEFNAWLQSLGHERTDWMTFVFPEQSGTAATQRLAWLCVRSKHAVEHIRTFVMDGEGRAARVPGLSSLSERTIVLIGCGSLGSKIATSLTATGISHFGLVDFDFIEPDNAVRHECGVSLFGVPKVLALEGRLSELNPEVLGNTKTLQMVIGGTTNIGTEKRLQELLAGASLVIDTTGVHGVSRFVNDICAEFGVSQVYASVSNGAWGGEVVRVIPGRTACWMCWFTQYESSRPSSEPTPDVGVFAPGCDQPTFTGTSYDLNLVAGLASSLAVDTLLIDDPGRQHYEGDYILWQMRNPEGRFLPTVEVLAVNKRNPCKFCNPK